MGVMERKNAKYTLTNKLGGEKDRKTYTHAYAKQSKAAFMKCHRGGLYDYCAIPSILERRIFNGLSKIIFINRQKKG